MHAGALAGHGARDIDPGKAAPALGRGADGLVGLAEDSHRAVAEPLDHDPPVLGDRLLLGGAYLSQQLDRRLVAGLERPVGEADQVGEQDRDVRRAPFPLPRVRERLPCLEHTEPQLADRARLLWSQLRELAADPLDPVAGGGRRIVVAPLAGQQAADQPCGRDQLGRRIDAPDPLRDARGLSFLGGLSLGVIARARAHGENRLIPSCALGAHSPGGENNRRTAMSR